MARLGGAHDFHSFCTSRTDFNYFGIPKPLCWLCIGQGRLRLQDYLRKAADYLEARTRIIPSRLGHPRGVCGRRSSRSERRTTPEAQDSTGFPHVASTPPITQKSVRCLSAGLCAGFQEVSDTVQTNQAAFYTLAITSGNGKAGNDSDRQRSDYGIVPPHL
jgi:hypothetical protein